MLVDINLVDRVVVVSLFLCGRFPVCIQCSGFANFIDEWIQCDFCFTNSGVILEYLDSSITTKKAIFSFPVHGPGMHTLS